MKILICVCVCWLSAVYGMTAHGEELDATSNGWRPLSKAALKLSERLGYIVTYEDPQYAYSGDLRDATAEIRSSGASGPRIFVPAGGTLDLRRVLLPEIKSIDAAGGVIQQALDAQDRSATGGKFKLLKTGDVLHIVPDRVRNEKGEWIPQQSILDTRISIPRKPRSTYVMVEEICNTLAKAHNLRVVFTTPPVALNATNNEEQGADDEVARDVLMRTLASTGNRYGWTLFYTAISDGNTYLLDLVQLPNPQSRANRPAPSQPAASDTPPGVVPPEPSNKK